MRVSYMRTESSEEEQVKRNGKRWALAATTAIAVGFAGIAGPSALGSVKRASAPYEVAVLSPGTAHDGSWGQAVSMGAQAAGKLHGVKVSYVANLNTPAQYQQSAASYASKGYKLVILANGSVPSVLPALAGRFPKTTFCLYATTVPLKRKNECLVNPVFQDGDFVAGYLAGLVSKHHDVGVIGGYNFATLNSEMEGFILGARFADPKIKVQETFINSWTDVSAARAAAEAQINAGADVIFSATDQATQGIYAAAESAKHTYVVSQYFDTHKQAPSVALTSVLLNLQGVTKKTIVLGAHGKLEKKNYIYGPKAGVGKLSPFYNLSSVVPKTAKKKLAVVEKDVASGKIKVPYLSASGAGKKYPLKKLR